MIALPKRAHVFWWKDLERWIVPALQHSAKLPEGWSLLRIGDLVKQVTDKVKVEQDSEYKLAGVRWYSEGVFHRETVMGSDSSATYLMPLIPGAFIYNRLFAWKESFAVVSDELNDCLVSNEFPQFLVNSEQLLVRYLYLFFMCKSTIRAVNKASIGSAAVSRNRYKEEYFLNVQIPLPPLYEQQEIIDCWQQAQTEIAATQTQSNSMEKQCKLNFLSVLGNAGHASTDKQRCFALPWAKVDRWSIEYLQRGCFGEDSFKWQHPCEPLSVLCKGQSGGTPLTSNGAFWNGDIPWVSPKDMKVLRISDAQDHISEDAVKYSSAPMIPAKSVLVVVRSGILQRFVPIAINEVPVSINQDIRAFTVTDERLLPEYLAYFLEARSDDLLSLVKWSTTVQSINREELEAYPIPLPPIQIQKRIVEDAEKMRAEVNKNRDSVKLQTNTIKTDIEAMILGTKKVEIR
jgi:type I restriction enzyme S subunit